MKRISFIILCECLLFVNAAYLFHGYPIEGINKLYSAMSNGDNKSEVRDSKSQSAQMRRVKFVQNWNERQGIIERHFTLPIIVEQGKKRINLRKSETMWIKRSYRYYF